MRTIPLTVNNRNILIQKEGNRYIKEIEIREVIEDIVENNLEIPIDKLINLSDICDKMFSIMYKGIITTIEKINGLETPTNNIVFEIC